jgi:hypothetical protein
MMTKEELLRTPAGSAAFADLTAEIAALKSQCEHKDREFWRIQRSCAETGQHCEAELRKMRIQCDVMRVEKLQIERGLAMLGTDDPTNVVLRLNKELEETREKLAQQTSRASMLAASLACCDKARVAELEKLLHEGREQAQAEVYELRRQHEEEVDAFRGEIHDLECQLEAAREDEADSSLEYAAQGRELKEAKARIAEMEEQLCAEHTVVTNTSLDYVAQHRELKEAKARITELECQLEESDHRRITQESTSAEEIRTLKARLVTEERHAEDLNTQLFHKDDELRTLRAHREDMSEADAGYISELNRELAEYADAVDDIHRQLRAHQSEVARKEQVILRLTRERNIWRNRHAVVTQSAQRLRGEVDEARKTVRPPLNPDAPEYVPRSSLNPVVQELKEAVQKRLAEKEAETEASRKATVEGMKAAVRARLATVAAAETPTLTIAEMSVPDYKVDWPAYKSFCVTKIQSLLNECAAAVGSAAKVPVAVRLFTFIKEHGMPFLRAYQKFRLTVISKCWEFKAEEQATAELRALSDWILEEFKSDSPQCGHTCENYTEFYKAQALYIQSMACLVPAGMAPDLTAIGIAPAPAPAVNLTTPIKRIPAPAAPEKRYRTRTRTGAIPRRDYAEESDSE